MLKRDPIYIQEPLGAARFLRLSQRDGGGKAEETKKEEAQEDQNFLHCWVGSWRMGPNEAMKGSIEELGARKGSTPSSNYS